jgi:protein gp37
VAEKTIIAWTDHTFNIAWGCEKVSPGCAHCYADTLSDRYGHHVWGKGAPRRTFGAKHWAEPLAWNKEAGRDGRRHRVFCSSMTDVFLDDPTIDREREKLWELVRRTPHLDWQLLTKRSDRIAGHLPSDWGDGYENVWLGVSVESQDYTHRLTDLLAVPAVVHFMSGEPLLGDTDVSRWLAAGLDWVIVGGESGAKFRLMDHDWARHLRDQCRDAGVAFFFKQSSAFFTERGTTLDGEVIRQFPVPAGRRSNAHCPC